ncbi:glycoside hydrolase family 9 protein [Marinoscillum pacificum]|uniref:glycoside hydrolase family 9 protein n=1 Tax=Marinoscillum pacificum TaxID=392723 RepID=UPI0021573A97|nr:glycoside hydrolase family 9 protein [Marinoscillum pacificum]
MNRFLHFLQMLLISLVVSQCAFTSKYGTSESEIKVNQVGFHHQGLKVAIISSPPEDTFQILDSVGQVVYSGEVLPSKFWDMSEEDVSILDFSDFMLEGSYYLKCGEVKSEKFVLKDNPYIDLIKASVKTYYFNRATTDLPEEFAGIYSRPYAHPDTAVMIHASAAGDFINAGTSISTPFGWYDAGDFNKYVVNSGITTYTLLMAYEHNRELFDMLTWNIPESTNKQADLLDEILWNIRWMETMQDQKDGGVFHKTTTANFEAFKEASEATSTRFVVKKGTAATLDFAGVMARASLVLRQTDPNYSDQLLVKAKAAWKWALEHPEVAFKNPISTDPAYPSIQTGEYGDDHFQDEFFWAGVELYLATSDPKYLEHVPIQDVHHFGVPNWASVESLGLISLATNDINYALKKRASDQLMVLSERLISQWRESPYRVTINKFVWGSNAEVMNQSMILLNAYKVLGNLEYFEAAVSGLDYVLGRNATGYCFVTGFGGLSPLKIHHRQSAADDIEAPIPGFLVGGPNPRNIYQDCGATAYPSSVPAKCYIDEECSYSTNEVAINWNAPLVYVSSSIHSIYSERFKMN